MVVRVRLFAILRERAGRSEIELDLPDGARVADALGRLDGLAGGLALVIAVNREYADGDAVLGPGDELALIPPVSGGSPAGGDPLPATKKPVQVRVSAQPLALDGLARAVARPTAGAVVAFYGVTRDVERLRYEAYVEMAEAQMARIVDAALTRHGLCAAAAEHRVGDVALGEPSVSVAASAPHRDAAFAGAREIIDAIKASVPIWKQEIDAGRATWVPGSTPTR